MGKVTEFIYYLFFKQAVGKRNGEFGFECGESEVLLEYAGWGWSAHGSGPPRRVLILG